MILRLIWLATFFPTFSKPVRLTNGSKWPFSCSLSTAEVTCQCLPDQKTCTTVLLMSSASLISGDNTVTWCHKVKATKLLPTRTLPLYASIHFNLDNRAHTFFLIPFFFFLLETHCDQKHPNPNPEHFKTLFTPAALLTDFTLLHRLCTVWTLHSSNIKTLLLTQVTHPEETPS